MHVSWVIQSRFFLFFFFFASLFSHICIYNSNSLSTSTKKEKGIGSEGHQYIHMHTSAFIFLKISSCYPFPSLYVYPLKSYNYLWRLPSTSHYRFYSSCSFSTSGGTPPLTVLFQPSSRFHFLLLLFSSLYNNKTAKVHWCYVSMSYETVMNQTH